MAVKMLAPEIGPVAARVLALEFRAILLHRQSACRVDSSLFGIIIQRKTDVENSGG